MADIDYPSNLPGVLVNSNAFEPQVLTRRNDLESGFPTFRLQSEDGWVAFNVAWSFDAAQEQLFQNWFRWTIANGSKLFNIGLWIDGSDGVKNTKEHECFIDGSYKSIQVGRRWQVTARLLALNLETFDEENGLSLVAAWEGFEDLPSAIISLDDVINTLENLWQP